MINKQKRKIKSISDDLVLEANLYIPEKPKAFLHS